MYILTIATALFSAPLLLFLAILAQASLPARRKSIPPSHSLLWREVAAFIGWTVANYLAELVSVRGPGKPSYWQQSKHPP
jgi:hypothetical protein